VDPKKTEVDGKEKPDQRDFVDNGLVIKEVKETDCNGGKKTTC
jgi:hypothetical protein